MAYYPPTDRELKDFFREHADAVYRSCGFLTCGKADTQKMVKDVFLKLLTNGMIFASEKDAKAWMILTAYKLSRKASKYAPAEEPEISEQQEPEIVSEENNIENGPEQTACDANELPAVASETEEPNREEVAEPQEAVPAAEEDRPAEEEPETAPVAAAMVFPPELQKLSRKDRLVALLYYCEGYRKSEIASYLGSTTFMISSRLKRIKKRILQESGGETAC